MKINLHPPLSLHEIGQRENNEDQIYPAVGSTVQFGHRQVYLVCDGVGGLDKGEIASNLTCDSIAAYLSQKETISDSVIEESIAHAETNINKYVANHKEANGMATTMTLLVIDEQGIAIAHIGDSRVYQIRGGKIIHKTFDHSFVNELIAQKIITEKEALTHPKRNVVTRAIMGGHTHQEADIFRSKDVLAGDYFLMCTDGITESNSDEEILSFLSNTSWSNQKKIAAIASNCALKSKDNYSAYLLQVKEIEKARVLKAPVVAKAKSVNYLFPIIILAALLSAGYLWKYESSINTTDDEEMISTIKQERKIEQPSTLDQDASVNEFRTKNGESNLLIDEEEKMIDSIKNIKE